MAIADDNLTFCDNVALNTGAAGTVYLLGSQIDTRKIRDIGNGEELHLVIDVGATGITCATDATGTLQFILASDATAILDVAVTGATRHFLTPTYNMSTTTNVNTLAPGTRLFSCPIPADGANPYELVLGIFQVPVTRAVTAGTVNIYLTTDPGNNRYYPNAI